MASCVSKQRQENEKKQKKKKKKDNTFGSRNKQLLNNKTDVRRTTI